MQKNTWYSGCGRVTLDIPIQAVEDCSHSGECIEDVRYWRDKIDWSEVKITDIISCLDEYGAWGDEIDLIEDDQTLSEDEMNIWKERILWIACGDLQEESRGQA